VWHHVYAARALFPQVVLSDLVLGRGLLVWALIPSAVMTSESFPRELASTTSLSTVPFPGMPMWALTQEILAVHPSECLLCRSEPMVLSIPDLAGWPLEMFTVEVSAVRESVRMVISGESAGEIRLQFSAMLR